MRIPGSRGVLRLLARLFVTLSQWPLTAEPLAGAVAWWLARRVSPIGARAGANAPTLFALSKARILPDGSTLAASGEFTVLTLPDSDQFLLTAPFFPGGADASAFFIDPGMAVCAARYRSFLARMMPKFLRRIGAEAVIGAHFMYQQDVHWGPAAQNAGFPYIVLFRESLKLAESERQTLIGWCKRLGRFEGELILTWNDIARDCILVAGYARAEQVLTTGTVRLSRFISSCRNGTPPVPDGARPTATLFSFNPGASLNGLGLDPWPRNKYAGWVRLFERTHTAFAAAAQAMPDARFVIKPKWGGLWITRIEQALLSRGMDPRSIPNLEIRTDIDANDLILASSLVVGFTSTTLLEAGLAGRRILIPDFEEALDPYFSQHIKLKEIYPFVEVARSADEVTERTLAALRQPGFLAEPAKRELTRFFSLFVSPANDDPLRKATTAIRDAIAKRAVARVA